MSLIADSLAAFVELLTDAQIPAVTDPRNLQPPGVLVDLPSIRSVTQGIVELTIPVVAVAPPPGNQDSVNRLIELMDDVFTALATQPVSAMTAEPGTYNLGSMDLPSYSTTVTIAYREDDF